MSQQHGTTRDLASALASVTAPDATRSKARPLDDVAATAVLGRHIAERAPQIDVVVVWNQPEDAVIAYSVALAGNARVVTAVQDEGIVELLGDIPSESSVLLLSDAFRMPNELRALSSLVERCGARTCGVAALSATAVLREADLDGAAVICVSDDASGA